MEERLPPEAPYLRAFLRKLAAGAADFDIDDLAQETMNRALRYQDSFDAAKPLRQWLLAIGFRVFSDHLCWIWPLFLRRRRAALFCLRVFPISSIGKVSLQISLQAPCLYKTPFYPIALNDAKQRS